MVQLSYPYMTTGKIVALTVWTFVSKVMSLLFNMLSRFVIDFLPWSKQLLISELQSPSTGQLKSYQIFLQIWFFFTQYFYFWESPQVDTFSITSFLYALSLLYSILWLNEVLSALKLTSLESMAHIWTTRYQVLCFTWRKSWLFMFSH